MEPIQDLLYPVVADVLRRAPLSDEKVLCAWRLAVGAGLARVTQVRLGGAGVLVVALADGRWHDDVWRSRALILERMRRVLGPETVTDLEIRVPRNDPAPKPPRNRRGGPRTSPR